MVKRLAVAVIVVGCIPSRRSILADGHRDLAALNRRTDAEVHALLETFEKETEEASTLLKSQTIYAACSERVPNGATCGLLLEQYRMDLRALQFVHRRCGGVPSDRCNEAYREDYFRALEARYEELPEAHCPDRACDLEALELSLLQTHNDRLTNAFITGGGARRATLKAKFSALLSRYKRAADAIVARTGARLQSAERRRRALAALAAGMQSIAQSMQRPSPMAIRPSFPSAATSGCASDFECGFGNVCAKPPGRLRGVCAKAVNEYGTPTFQAPRGSSIGPGGRECTFSTQCPPSFACIDGHCMK